MTATTLPTGELFGAHSGPGTLADLSLIIAAASRALRTLSNEPASSLFGQLLQGEWPEGEDSGPGAEKNPAVDLEAEAKPQYVWTSWPAAPGGQLVQASAAAESLRKAQHGLVELDAAQAEPAPGGPEAARASLGKRAEFTEAGARECAEVIGEDLRAGGALFSHPPDRSLPGGHAGLTLGVARAGAPWEGSPTTEKAPFAVWASEQHSGAQGQALRIRIMPGSAGEPGPAAGAEGKDWLGSVARQDSKPAGEPWEGPSGAARPAQAGQGDAAPTTLPEMAAEAVPEAWSTRAEAASLPESDGWLGRHGEQVSDRPASLEARAGLGQEDYAAGAGAESGLDGERGRTEGRSARWSPGRAFEGSNWAMDAHGLMRPAQEPTWPGGESGPDGAREARSMGVPRQNAAGWTEASAGSVPRGVDESQRAKVSAEADPAANLATGAPAVGLASSAAHPSERVVQEGWSSSKVTERPAGFYAAMADSPAASRAELRPYGHSTNVEGGRPVRIGGDSSVPAWSTVWGADGGRTPVWDGEVAFAGRLVRLSEPLRTESVVGRAAGAGAVQSGAARAATEESGTGAAPVLGPEFGFGEEQGARSLSGLAQPQRAAVSGPAGEGRQGHPMVAAAAASAAEGDKENKIDARPSHGPVAEAGARGCTAGWTVPEAATREVEGSGQVMPDRGKQLSRYEAGEAQAAGNPAERGQQAADAAPLRELRFGVANAGRRVGVEVRVRGEGQDLGVAVRTPQPELIEALRSNLPELTARLAERGIEAHLWRPGSAAVGPQSLESRLESKAGLGMEAETATGRRQPGQEQPDGGREQRRPDPWLWAEAWEE